MTTSNGVNLEGFGNTGEQSGPSNTIDGNYSPATGSFPAAGDKSTQGNAGLGKNG
jgi:hypothetical protein